MSADDLYRSGNGISNKEVYESREGAMGKATGEIDLKSVAIRFFLNGLLQWTSAKKKC